MVWEIREYGAVDDGRTVNTAVIQNTIDRCHQAGGGTVLIEGGVYLCGTIFLRSNVTLEIAQGTVLKANPDISDYARIPIITDIAMRKHWTDAFSTEKIWKISGSAEKDVSKAVRRHFPTKAIFTARC